MDSQYFLANPSGDLCECGSKYFSKASKKKIEHTERERERKVEMKWEEKDGGERQETAAAR